MPKINLKASWSLSTTFIYSLIIVPLLIITAPLSRHGRLSFYFGKLWSWLILKTNGVKLQVHGSENIIKNESYIFISNHTSNLDPPIVALSVGHVVRFVSKKSVLKVPLFGYASKLAKMIFIDRDDAAGSVEILNQNINDLNHGISACFFAEGTRSSDGVLGKFKKGGVVLAINSGIAIVPITIAGSWNVLPRNSFSIKAGIVQVIIDKPIDVCGLSIESKDEITEKVKSIINSNLEKYIM